MAKRKPIPRLFDERADIDVAESTNAYVAKILADAKRVAAGLEPKFKHIVGDVTKMDIDSIINNAGLTASNTPSVETIKIYLLDKPVAHSKSVNENTQNYVTYNVIDVLDIEAGSTFGELKSAISSKGYSTSGIGVFNVNTGVSSGTHNFVYQENTEDIIGVQSGFSLGRSVKKGDVIDSSEYCINSYGYWPNQDWSSEDSGYYQSSTEFNECSSSYFEDGIIIEEGIAFILPHA